MEQTAEHVLAPHKARTVDHGHRPRGGKAQLKASVGPLSVVMGDVLAEHQLEVAAAEDEQVVGAFASYRPHPALGESVRSWGLDRAFDHPGTHRSEDGVEGRRELGVAVPDQEREREPFVLEVADKVAGHLGGPWAIGVPRHTEDVDGPALESRWRRAHRAG